MSVEETGEVNALTVSGHLQQAREAAGLTQAAVADQLFLTETYIRYMDDGEFERLPKQAFVRGYLRSYARVVGLDGGVLVQLYDEAYRQAQPEAPADVSVSVKENRFSGPVVLTGLIGLGIVGILVLLVWLFIPDENGAEAAVTKPASVPPALITETAEDVAPDSTEAFDQKGRRPSDAPLFERAPVENTSTEQAQGEQGLSVKAGALSAPAAALQPTLDAGLAKSTAAAPASEASALTIAENIRVEDPNLDLDLDLDPDLDFSVAVVDAFDFESTGTELGELDEDELNVLVGPDAFNGQGEANFNLDAERGASGQVNIRRENRDNGRQILVNAGGTDELKATLIGECWIEVADSQNELIYGDLNRAGDVLLLTGRAPLTVLLGNAPMASIEFNGRLVDLESATTRDAIARLTLTN